MSLILSNILFTSARDPWTSTSQSSKRQTLLPAFTSWASVYGCAFVGQLARTLLVNACSRSAWDGPWVLVEGGAMIAPIRATRTTGPPTIASTSGSHLVPVCFGCCGAIAGASACGIGL